MSDLLRRIKRPRRTPAAGPAPGSAAYEPAEAPLEASPGAGGSLLAGEDLADQRPTTLRRGRLRKRLRFLERERELLLRDLGGLVYEIHRTGTSADREHHRTLVADKVARLGGLDSELESGLAALGEARGDRILREPGIGGLCPRCGEIHGSDARFCSACGFPLELAGTPGAASAAAAATGEAIVPASHAFAAAAPAVAPSVGAPAAVAPVPDVNAATPEAIAPDAVTPTAAVPIEDAPTRVVRPRAGEPAGADDTGELPPADSEPR